MRKIHHPSMLIKDWIYNIKIYIINLKSFNIFYILTKNLIYTKIILKAIIC